MKAQGLLRLNEFKSKGDQKAALINLGIILVTGRSELSMEGI
jgi:hypothetical protein